MLEREHFSTKTLGKILFNFQNEWSGKGPAGQLWQMESALSSFNICPFHRSELGIGWWRNSYSNSCQVPKESANHIIERRGKPVKDDKRVKGRTFQNISISKPVSSFLWAQVLLVYSLHYILISHLNSIHEYWIKFIIVVNSLSNPESPRYQST